MVWRADSTEARDQWHFKHIKQKKNLFGPHVQMLRIQKNLQKTSDEYKRKYFPYDIRRRS